MWIQPFLTAIKQTPGRNESPSFTDRFTPCWFFSERRQDQILPGFPSEWRHRQQRLPWKLCPVSWHHGISFALLCVWHATLINLSSGWLKALPREHSDRGKWTGQAKWNDDSRTCIFFFIECNWSSDKRSQWCALITKILGQMLVTRDAVTRSHPHVLILFRIPRADSRISSRRATCQPPTTVQQQQPMRAALPFSLFCGPGSLDGRMSSVSIRSQMICTILHQLLTQFSISSQCLIKTTRLLIAFTRFIKGRNL